jgi:hypothetical protein
MEAVCGLDPPVAAEHGLLHAHVCIDRLRLCFLLDGNKDDYRRIHQTRLL